MIDIVKRNWEHAAMNDLQNIVDLRERVGSTLMELRISTINQRKELLKHISLISAAVLGLVTFAFSKDVSTDAFVISGVALHFLVILSTLSFLREELDAELTELQSQHDGFNKLFEKMIGVVQETKGTDPVTAWGRINEFKSSAEWKKLLKDKEEIEDARDNRETQTLNFFFEMVIAMFAIGSASLLVPLLDTPPTSIQSIGFVLLVITFTFSDQLRPISQIISNQITWLKRPR